MAPEKTDLTSRLAFLEEENRKLAEDRERLKEERRKEEEKRWHGIEKGLQSVNQNVNELRSEVRASSQSTSALHAVVTEMKTNQAHTALILTGGDKPETGLLFRTKQIEDDHAEHVEEHKENKKWWLGLGTVAVISFFKSLWDVVTHR